MSKTYLAEPTSLPLRAQARLYHVPSDHADALKIANDIPLNWECRGASPELCHLTIIADQSDSETETAGGFINLCEAPVGRVYCLFSSPERSAHTIIVADRAHLFADKAG